MIGIQNLADEETFLCLNFKVLVRVLKYVLIM